ncbi:MAG: hypothetical protein KatS3mg059_1462 [Thermomicrobiales bacterium]|nr:MAG: hypothetical protein KatS3mg059_1462 [Thermomicrobiales bacterium]
MQRISLPSPLRHRNQSRRPKWNVLLLVPFTVALAAIVVRQLRDRRGTVIPAADAAKQEPTRDVTTWRHHLAGDHRGDVMERSAVTPAMASPTPEISQASTTMVQPRGMPLSDDATTLAAIEQAMPSEPAPPPSVADWIRNLEGEAPDEPNEDVAFRAETSPEILPNPSQSATTASRAATSRPASEGRVSNPAEPATTPPAEGNGWIHAPADGGCPERYPIKGNASSRIYHLPGEPSYEATNPEICFASEEAAAALGYRPRRR